MPAMPRTARASVGNVIYHVLNRGNGKSKIFFNDGDYAAFLVLLALACQRIPMRVLCVCLMPNHFHLILWPYKDGDLSRWMQWLMTSHVRRYHRHHGTSGHVWQGRFKAFPIQCDEHLITVIRYVERNAVRARLCKSAQDWRWSSLHLRGKRPAVTWLSSLPVDLPRGWTTYVNEPQTPAELEAVRHTLKRGAPFGDRAWSRKIAARLGLESSLRPRGRPRIEKK
jgi:putative transposase